MIKTIRSSANYSARQGLYRVWVPLHDDGKAPLISIWIDSTMTALEREQRQQDIGRSSASDGAVAEEVEDSRRWDLYCKGFESESGNGFTRRCKVTEICAAA
jgi:hypothetical protein